MLWRDIWWKARITEEQLQPDLICVSMYDGSANGANLVAQIDPEVSALELCAVSSGWGFFIHPPCPWQQF